MVIDDAPLAALTPERMRSRHRTQGARRMAAARSNAKNESRLLRHVLVCLEHFRQSGAGKLQRGECISRCSLAHHRQALGLPALTVNWGVLGGEGYVARNERVADFLARQGTMGISPGEAMSLLESFLRAGSAQAISIRVDWGKWRQFFRSMQENPLLERIFAALENQESVGPHERLAEPDRCGFAG